MIRPNDRITRNTKSMRQRVTPAKPQPAIHFHRTGAVQPGPFKRQDPIERTIGQRQQFLPGNHRYRAAIGRGLIRRSRRIPRRIFRTNRHIVHRLLPHQHRPLGLVPNHRHRIGNHLIPSLQRHIRNHPDRRRRAPQQNRFGQRCMVFHACLPELPGHMLQPPARPLRLDALQHLRTHAHRHAHPGSGKTQQQIDQYFSADFPQQLVHVRRRQQPHPADHRRQIDKQQRLITKHQQALSDAFGAEFQQLFKLVLRQVMQEFFGMPQRV
ncbi:hypothetical protein [Pseudomonas sp. 35 E 8]|nr:hypothetical protein [Pseudomonas sp. 35 E 8]